MLRVRVLDEARREYADAVRVFRQLDPDFARRMVDAYRKRIRRVRRFPKLGTLEVEYSDDDFEVRRHLLKGYHHKVIIAELRHELVVVAVAHKRRPPGYWADRLRELKAHR